MKKIFFLLITAVITSSTFAQKHQFQCGSQPTKAQLQYIDQLTQSWANKSTNSNDTLVIPVVVHVIHGGSPVGSNANISDEQIYSAINALNMHYAGFDESFCERTEDSKIRFRLAEKDPSGNPHSGIIRINGAALSQDYADYGVTWSGVGENVSTVKSWSMWPHEDYENIWIVTEIDGNNAGGGVQGYANYPSPYSNYQGIIQLFNTFGTVGNLKSYTNENKTTSHEFGHRMNLLHTHEGDACSETSCSVQGDRVCDTPPTTQEGPCGLPVCDLEGITENFMSYLSQNCRDKFTGGQIARMRDAADNANESLTESSPYRNLTQSLQFLNLDVTSQGDCNGTVYPTITFKNNNSNRLYKVNFTYGVTGGNTQHFKWWGLLRQNQQITFCLPDYNNYGGTQNEFYVEGLGEEITSSFATSCMHEVTLDLSNYCPDTLSIDVNGSVDLYTVNDGEVDLSLADGSQDIELLPDGYLDESLSIQVNDDTTIPVTLSAGDFDGNGSVDIGDITMIIGAYGASTGSMNYDPICDFNCDGYITLNDITLMLSNYGQVSALYPNPFKNHLNIASKGKYSLKFIGQNGDVHTVKGYGPGRVSVDKLRLRHGMYIVQIETKKGVFLQRVIKSKR